MPRTRKQKRVLRYTRKRKVQRGGDISVKFQGKEANGKLRPRGETLLQPVVSWSTVPGKLYTVVMWDPDAPAASWLHLLVTNLSSSNLSHGNILLPYTPPSPPSGTHRYYTTVFEQPRGKLDIAAPSERGNFDVEEFVRSNGLVKLGEQMIRVSA